MKVLEADELPAIVALEAGQPEYAFSSWKSIENPRPIRGGDAQAGVLENSSIEAWGGPWLKRGQPGTAQADDRAS